MAASKLYVNVNRRFIVKRIPFSSDNLFYVDIVFKILIYFDDLRVFLLFDIFTLAVSRELKLKFFLLYFLGSVLIDRFQVTLGKTKIIYKIIKIKWMKLLEIWYKIKGLFSKLLTFLRKYFLIPQKPWQFQRPQDHVSVKNIFFFYLNICWNESVEKSVLRIPVLLN